ncbi:hypothetical protein GCM10010149_19790 [Nonomuraea roseoviolacea subsp. roseoviolacea]|uniref:Uncharacterized protein n=1 Tax=Nonomuraea roseoviolacea subsp. carminata TaxID=160689 RepID=A0ABT1KEB4_9ACTN|nr:hypothetical protein [Nonomuraea roseoviolacea]MCP2352017.1 hypothetical protein [Nonomuraea roseoviolacea subsp. carminata]
MRGDGYTASPHAIGRSGQESAQEAERVRGVLHDVREAFAEAGRPMGHDQYGAELEKRYPSMRDGVLAAFDAYIDELDGTGKALHVSAATYQAADHPKA